MFKTLDNGRFNYYRDRKRKKRCSEVGFDISYENIEPYIQSMGSVEEKFSQLEYNEMVGDIEKELNFEQKKILNGKLEGYSLKEIADNNRIKGNQVYRKFKEI